MFDDDMESYFAMPEYPWLEKLYLPTRHYYVRAANSLVRSVIEREPDYLAIIDDDCEFIQPGWAEACVQHFTKTFSGGLGIMDLLSFNECCHVFTTPAFVRRMGGALYDPAYTQFYHDTDLRKKVEQHFAHFNLIGDQPFFIHKRDFGGGANHILKDMKRNDFQTFKARAEQNGWDLYEQV